MAERRMFAKTVIDSDAFLDMPMSAQALYFHMAMRADDDGFLNNPKKIPMPMINKPFNLLFAVKPIKAITPKIKVVTPKAKVKITQPFA